LIEIAPEQEKLATNLPAGKGRLVANFGD